MNFAPTALWAVPAEEGAAVPPSTSPGGSPEQRQQLRHHELGNKEGKIRVGTVVLGREEAVRAEGEPAQHQLLCPCSSHLPGAPDAEAGVERALLGCFPSPLTQDLPSSHHFDPAD